METQVDTSDSSLQLATRKLLAVAKVAGRVAFRFAMVVLIVGVAIAAGMAIPYQLRHNIASLPPAGIAFGAAVILAVAKQLLESLPSAYEFVVSGLTNSLPKLFAQVAVAVLGFGFAYYSMPDRTALNHDREPSGTLTLNVRGSLPPVVLNDSDALLTTYVVFGEREEKLADRDPQIELVENLVTSLATCLQAPSDNAHLIVRAYASSSGADADNEALYKARAGYVSRLLKERIAMAAPAKSSQFTVETREWRSLQIMKLRRLFKDTDDNGQYLQDAGSLNRRAEIKVRTAGSCYAG